MNKVVTLGNVNPSGRGMNGAVYDSGGLCPTLTTNKGEGVKVGVKDAITMIGGLQAHQTPRSDGICPCVNSAAGMGGGQTPIAFRPGFRVRKLTPRECWRLMGFCDNQFDRARKAMNEKIYNGRDKCGSQLYKQAGNSIVVDVLEQIMENLYDAMPYLFEDMTVGSFFSGIGAFEAALTRLDPAHVEKPTGDAADAELRQIGYINNYNGDANRIYDGSTISRALKAEAGGGGAQRPDGTASRSVTIFDRKQEAREGKPRIYCDGFTPSLVATESKKTLCVLEE